MTSGPQYFLRMLSSRSRLIGVQNRNRSAAFSKAWHIGADAVVFIDDSPMELAEVKQAHPAVECIRFPQGDAAGIYELLRRLRDLFGRSAIREEDAIRLASLRQAEAIPRDDEASELTRESFLEHAEAELTITFAKETLDPRALELVNKTNQFNLNGKRHTQTSLQSYLRDPNAFLMVVSYKDKYGPLGKIAVIAGHLLARTLSIDTWVMSCRAFARRIEHRCLDELIAKFSPDEIEFDFTETVRNGPIRTFLIEALGTPPNPHTARPVQGILNGGNALITGSWRPSMDKVGTGLSQCFAAVFPELTPEEILAATPATVKSWDSVATLNLLTVIEEKFGIEIDFTKLLESLSYEQIAVYIRMRLDAQEGLGAA